MVIIFNYKINERIGKGSFSSVYAANSVDDKSKQYAVKVIKMNKISDQLKAKIKLEVDILSNTSHPNIITLYDSFYHENILYLVLERCQTNLYTEIQKNTKISVSTKIDWIKQLLSGIIYLHKNKIIHRDLKPQNILLNTDNKLKIIDFGFARYFGSEDLMNTICGSPLYMSPELFITHSYDYKSDYWSLGIIIYLIIVGSMPYNAKNIMELVAKLKNITDIKIPSYIRNLYDDDLIHLVESMLITSTKYRINYDELLHNQFVTKNKLNNLFVKTNTDHSYNTIADLLVNTNDDLISPSNEYNIDNDCFDNDDNPNDNNPNDDNPNDDNPNDPNPNDNNPNNSNPNNSNPNDDNPNNSNPNNPNPNNPSPNDNNPNDDNSKNTNFKKLKKKKCSLNEGLENNKYGSISEPSSYPTFDLYFEQVSNSKNKSKSKQKTTLKSKPILSSSYKESSIDNKINKPNKINSANMIPIKKFDTNDISLNTNINSSSDNNSDKEINPELECSYNFDDVHYNYENKLEKSYISDSDNSVTTKSTTSNVSVDKSEIIDKSDNFNQRSKPIPIKQNNELISSNQSTLLFDIQITSPEDYVLNNTFIYKNYFSAPVTNNLAKNMKQQFEPQRNGYFKNLKDTLGTYVGKF
jgi:serine/threonine protein kinase